MKPDVRSWLEILGLALVVFKRWRGWHCATSSAYASVPVVHIVRIQNSLARMHLEATPQPGVARLAASMQSSVH